jgi:hypothetical protein
MTDVIREIASFLAMTDVIREIASYLAMTDVIQEIASYLAMTGRVIQIVSLEERLSVVNPSIRIRQSVNPSIRQSSNNKQINNKQ